MSVDPYVLIIPVVSALVGWVTNVLAVKMLFAPLDFVGVGRHVGWQGIVPANAVRMAKHASNLITSKLLRLNELFVDFDADRFVRDHLDETIDDITERVIEVLTQHNPQLGAPQRDMLRPLMRQEVQKVVAQILADVGTSIDEIIDVKSIVVAATKRDRKLIGDMFEHIGSEEFRFIKRSGAYFGFLFGLVPTVVWTVYPVWWLLPLFGFWVGYLTNWLAIKLIFEPIEPKKIGPKVIQGLFHKRQKEVAVGFSRMVADEFLHVDNMVQGMLTGPCGDKLFAIIDSHMASMVERYRRNPLTQGLLSDAQWDQLGSELPKLVRADLSKEQGLLQGFTKNTIDIYGELHARMVKLDSESFESILRPVFKQDEWKLIIIGAILGLGAGVVQSLYLLRS